MEQTNQSNDTGLTTLIFDHFDGTWEGTPQELAVLYILWDQPEKATSEGVTQMINRMHPLTCVKDANITIEPTTSGGRIRRL